RAGKEGVGNCRHSGPRSARAPRAGYAPGRGAGGAGCWLASSWTGYAYVTVTYEVVSWARSLLRFHQEVAHETSTGCRVVSHYEIRAGRGGCALGGVRARWGRARWGARSMGCALGGVRTGWVLAGWDARPCGVRVRLGARAEVDRPERWHLRGRK